ncbi:hypothetical protein [Paraburkholderia youngii]|uniref:hypothetical protein n=1 Tax=Paraburkholderia youngii TaxID=2782701 RepID=UPI003D1A90E5
MSKIDASWIVESARISGETRRHNPITVNGVNNMNLFRQTIDIIGPLEQLSSGKWNNVYRTTYRSFDGEVKPGVFKPQRSYARASIPDSKPRLWLDPFRIGSSTSARNVAAYQLSKHLEFDVIPFTAHARHQQRDGIVMSLVAGESATKRLVQEDLTDEAMVRTILRDRERWTRVTPASPDGPVLMRALSYTADEMRQVQRDLRLACIDEHGRIKVYRPLSSVDLGSTVAKRALVKLQLLDAIVGTFDRHASNYIIEKSHDTGDITGIKGIDNDFCFPNRMASYTEMSNAYPYHVGLPRVIDEEMRDRILSLTPQIADDLLRDLLQRSEIEATNSRISDIQRQIKRRPANDIISDYEWQCVNFFDPNYSYIARDGKIPVLSWPG